MKLNQIAPQDLKLEDIPKVAKSEQDGLVILAEIFDNRCPMCGDNRIEIRWDDAADLIGFCHHKDCGYFQVGSEDE